MSGWRTADAPAKLNLALVVGPVREDGKHEVVTVLERLQLADTIAVRRSSATGVEGFAEDTLVRDALDALADDAGGSARFEARLEKRIPVAAGLGGGSSDAATALGLANSLLDEPLTAERVDRLAARLGADVPFFVREGPQLATADGTVLKPIELPRGYVVLLALPHGAAKESTRAVYDAFDARGGDEGFERRRDDLERALSGVRTVADLATLPPNDLASSPLAAELLRLGAFRADVTGAGPVVFGLFVDDPSAKSAEATVAGGAQTWITRPV